MEPGGAAGRLHLAHEEDGLGSKEEKTLCTSQVTAAAVTTM